MAGIGVALLAVLCTIAVSQWWVRGAAPGTPPADAQLQRTLERLLKQLRDDDEDASAALVAIGPAALPALREALRDPDEDFRVAVLETAQKIGGVRSGDLFLSALDDTSEEVRLAAVEGLGAVQDRRAVAPLLALYGREEDQQVRYECLTSLGRIGDPAAADLLIAETRDRDPNARGWAIDALCQLSDARTAEIALAMLRDPSPFVRRQCLQSCKAVLNGALARQTLIRLAIDDRDFETTVWARRLLDEQLTDAPNRDALVEQMRQQALTTLQDRGAGKLQQLQAALLLGQIGDERATSVLIDGLTAPNLAMRQHAAHLLGRLPDRRAVPALIAALRDREPLIQATVYDSLQQHAGAGDERARTALQDYAGPRFNQPLAR